MSILNITRSQFVGAALQFLSERGVTIESPMSIEPEDLLDEFASALTEMGIAFIPEPPSVGQTISSAADFDACLPGTVVSFRGQTALKTTQFWALSSGGNFLADAMEKKAFPGATVKMCP